MNNVWIYALILTIVWDGFWYLMLPRRRISGWGHAIETFVSWGMIVVGTAVIWTLYAAMMLIMWMAS